MSLPTRGQMQVMRWAFRDNRRIKGMRENGTISYLIVELSPLPPSRVVMSLTSRMVASLLAAGWIEIGQQTKTEWYYRPTQAGIEAVTGPTKE